MTARRLVNWILVCMPVILLLSIAIEGRYGPREQPWPTTSQAQQERLRAYGPIIKKTITLTDRPAQELDTVRALALEWMRLSANGTLREIYSIMAGHSMATGQKERMFSAKSMLARQLVSSAADPEGDPATKVEDLILAVSLGEILKYGDFEAVRASVDDQRRALHELRAACERLSREDRMTVRAALAQLRARQLPLAPLLAIVSRQLREIPGAEAWWPPIPRDDSLHLATQAIERGHAQCDNEEGIMALGQVRAGLQAQSLFLRDLDELVDTLPKHPASYLASH